MLSFVEVNCENCGAVVKKVAAEYARSVRLGRRFFCSRTCAAQMINGAKKAQEFVLTCPHCGERFVTSTRRRAKRHCSRACASAASVTETRREAARKAGEQNKGNLLSPAETLRRREAWKYAALRDHLEKQQRDFQFEYALGKWVFDLALLDVKTLVEFDGRYHNEKSQRVADAKKERYAKKYGFVVVRRTTLSVTVISPDSITGL